jgi:hypothetical protein
MAAPQEKIRIEIYPAVDDSVPVDVRRARANEAVLSLARLIGKQMAREQFERKLAAERKTEKRRDRSHSPK